MLYHNELHFTHVKILLISGKKKIKFVAKIRSINYLK